jgi:hypothetical protein
MDKINFDEYKPFYNGEEYKMSGKAYYGNDIVRSFHNSNKEQLGCTMFNEKELLFMSQIGCREYFKLEKMQRDEKLRIFKF